MDYINQYKSKLGNITMASDGENLIGLWFDGQKYDRITLSKDFIKKDLEIFNQTKKWLDLYFSNKKPSFTPQFKLNVTDFRKKVINLLLEIPYGEITTYSDLALKMCKKYNISKMSARPIGNAISHNPISIIIPCHRVVGKDMKLTGYAGGINKKIKLLELEAVNISNFKI